MQKLLVYIKKIVIYYNEGLRDMNFNTASNQMPNFTSLPGDPTGEPLVKKRKIGNPESDVIQNLSISKTKAFKCNLTEPMKKLVLDFFQELATMVRDPIFKQHTAPIPVVNLDNIPGILKVHPSSISADTLQAILENSSKFFSHKEKLIDDINSPIFVKQARFSLNKMLGAQLSTIFIMRSDLWNSIEEYLTSDNLADLLIKIKDLRQAYLQTERSLTTATIKRLCGYQIEPQDHQTYYFRDQLQFELDYFSFIYTLGTCKKLALHHFSEDAVPNLPPSPSLWGPQLKQKERRPNVFTGYTPISDVIANNQHKNVKYLFAILDILVKIATGSQHTALYNLNQLSERTSVPTNTSSNEVAIIPKNTPPKGLKELIVHLKSNLAAQLGSPNNDELSLIFGILIDEIWEEMVKPGAKMKELFRNLIPYLLVSKQVSAIIENLIAAKINALSFDQLRQLFTLENDKAGRANTQVYFKLAMITNEYLSKLYIPKDRSDCEIFFTRQVPQSFVKNTLRHLKNRIQPTSFGQIEEVVLSLPQNLSTYMIMKDLPLRPKRISIEAQRFHDLLCREPNVDSIGLRSYTTIKLENVTHIRISIREGDCENLQDFSPATKLKILAIDTKRIYSAAISSIKRLMKANDQLQVYISRGSLSRLGKSNPFNNPTWNSLLPRFEERDFAKSGDSWDF